jgi:hypothetical protein
VVGVDDIQYDCQLTPARGDVWYTAGESSMPAKAAAKRATGTDAERQLTRFIDKFAEKDRRLIRAVRKAVRRRLPGAIELVYDNYNFFVIGYSPNERPSDAIVSITARANSVGLCFVQGASLPDPKKILRGAGNQTRSIQLESAAVLAKPEVEALIAAAVDHSDVPLPSKSRGQLIIRSISAKQRPRRAAPPAPKTRSKQ